MSVFKVTVGAWKLSDSHETAGELWDSVMTEDDIFPDFTIEVPLSAFEKRPFTQKDRDAVRAAGKAGRADIDWGTAVDAAGNAFDAWPYDVVDGKVVLLVDNWRSPTGRRRPPVRRS